MPSSRRRACKAQRSLARSSIATKCAELRELARAADEPLLVHLLDMVVLESTSGNLLFDALDGARRPIRLS